jgi:hypothetical protein
LTSLDFTGLSTIFGWSFVDVDIENPRIIFEVFFFIIKEKKECALPEIAHNTTKKALQRLNEARYAHN